jgi:hypothetical protein
MSEALHRYRFLVYTYAFASIIWNMLAVALLFTGGPRLCGVAALFGAGLANVFGDSFVATALHRLLKRDARAKP